MPKEQTRLMILSKRLKESFKKLKTQKFLTKRCLILNFLSIIKFKKQKIQQESYKKNFKDKIWNNQNLKTRLKAITATIT